MKFKGTIGQVPVFALIDSESTHSFMNLAVLQAQAYHIVSTNPMVVIGANENKMVKDSKCEALLFSIQNYEFKHDLRVLLIKGYDVILGLDWLSKLGPMRIDSQQNELISKKVRKWLSYKLLLIILNCS
jgi:Retroviral aspartyl protease